MVTRVGLLFALLIAVVAYSADDIDVHRHCEHCGMDRKAYGFSRMLVQYEDGISVGVCSLRCAITEMDANPGRSVRALYVADRDTRELIDAKSAVWVMGGSKSGVMTIRPKWAFGGRAGADAFIRSYGGEIVSWEEALRAGREDAAKGR